MPGRRVEGAAMTGGISSRQGQRWRFHCCRKEEGRAGQARVSQVAGSPGCQAPCLFPPADLSGCTRQRGSGGQGRGEVCVGRAVTHLVGAVWRWDDRTVSLGQPGGGGRDTCRAVPAARVLSGGQRNGARVQRRRQKRGCGRGNGWMGAQSLSLRRPLCHGPPAPPLHLE